MWEDILKTPILTPDEAYAVKNNDGFLYLLNMSNSFLTREGARAEKNKIWESNDGRARAKVRLHYYVKNGKTYPYWAILAFELKYEFIGKGLGEGYVREMREELQSEEEVPLVGGEAYQSWSIKFWKRMKTLGLIDWDMN